MAGTLRFKIEQFVSEPSDYLQSQVIFKNLHDFLVAHPNVTRIALYYGIGGTGTDYHDEANPFGERAFAVFRFEPSAARAWPYYISIYYSGNDGVEDWLNEGGTLSTNTGYVLISACVGIGGDQNPWNGTTNNDGTDTFGTPRWTNPAGGTNYCPIPVNSRLGSTYGANGNNALKVYSEATDGQPTRHAFIADDDHLVIVWDEDDDQVSLDVTYIGLYTPQPNVAADRPLAAFRVNVGAGVPNPFGGSANTAGIAHPDETQVNNSALTADFNHIGNLFTTALQVNELGNNDLEPQIPIIFCDQEVGHRGFVGWLDTLPGFALVYNMIGLDKDANENRIAIGNATAAATKFLVPWIGNSPSVSWGNGLTRQGQDFTRVP